jgi:hypothetical protein
LPNAQGVLERENPQLQDHRLDKKRIKKHNMDKFESQQQVSSINSYKSFLAKAAVSPT